MKILIILAVIIAAHFLINFIRLMSAHFYYKKFLKSDKSLEQYAYPVSRLFDKAGTNRILMSTRYAGEKISFCIAKYEYRGIVDDTFQQTIGVFKFRMRNSFNPLYWLELPTRLCKLYGAELPKPIDALLSAVFWLFSVIIGYYVEKFLDSEFFSNLLATLCNSLK